MRRMLRWLFGLDNSPPPRLRALEARCDDVEDELSTVKVRHESLRGQVLTLARQLRRLREDDPDDEEEDELMRMIEERKRGHG